MVDVDDSFFPLQVGQRPRRRSILLIVVDKAVTVDNRIFSAALMAVFLFFVFAIALSLFMLSIYIWMK